MPTIKELKTTIRVIGIQLYKLIIIFQSLLIFFPRFLYTGHSEIGISVIGICNRGFLVVSESFLRVVFFLLGIIADSIVFDGRHRQFIFLFFFDFLILFFFDFFFLFLLGDWFGWGRLNDSVHFEAIWNKRKYKLIIVFQLLVLISLFAEMFFH